MAKVVTLNQALKVWTATILSAVLLYLGGQLSDLLIAEPASLATRWAGVMVASLSPVPWIVMIAWGVGLADEYHRRVALIGTAVAFVLEFIVHVAFNVMRDARLISGSAHLTELPVAIAAWMFGIALAGIYYRYYRFQL